MFPPLKKLKWDFFLFYIMRWKSAPILRITHIDFSSRLGRLRPTGLGVKPLNNLLKNFKNCKNVKQGIITLKKKKKELRI